MAQCIGYGLAAEIFDLIVPTEVSHQIPNSWVGHMANVSYGFGGFLKYKRTLKLNVFNSKKIARIHNVLASIKGYLEPDRYVIIGSHRDAWTFGSVDPSSAQSVLLEVSRSLSQLMNKTSWQPKRTILFASWSGEEYGLLGSTEFVEVSLNYKKK